MERYCISEKRLLLISAGLTINNEFCPVAVFECIFIKYSMLFFTTARSHPLQNMDEIGTYISLALLNGALNVRTRLGGKKTFSQSTPYRIDDNEAHLVALSRDSNNITVSCCIS